MNKVVCDHCKKTYAPERIEYKHRLMCGDSTKKEDVMKLMDGKKVDMVVTSPPYGVGKTYEKKGLDEWYKTVTPIIKNLSDFVPIVCWNIGNLSPTGSQYEEPTFLFSSNIFIENGYRSLWTRIWEKPGYNCSIAPYHLVSFKPKQDYEWIGCFGKGKIQFKKRLSIEDYREWGWNGIWRMSTVGANREHPAKFPIELPARCIKLMSDEESNILEPFGGSGTTMMASEQLNRYSYLMEIDPVYCDVICLRYEKMTGTKPHRTEGL